VTFFAAHGTDGEVPKTRLYRIDFSIPDTVAVGIASGSHAVTPASMAHISTGLVLPVSDTFLSTVAVAPSPATSGTTLTLATGDGAKLHGSSFYVNIYPTGELATSLARETCHVTGVSGDVITIVRAASPRTIVVGDQVSVCISSGASTDESVTVASVTSTTFTATFANAHADAFDIGIPAPVYWTDFDIDIMWDSKRWVAQPITQSQVTHQPSGDTASFRIGDADNVLFPILDSNNGGELSPASIYEAGFLTTNKTAVPDEVLQIFAGVVDNCSIATSGEDNITINLMPPVQQNSGQLPTRLVSTLVRVT
jgi:hypothetical protein